MNSGYICILYLFNMWILYNVSDPFEILGSVIFFQFVFDLDEEIARSSWWDGNKRLLRAGIISTILQNAIERSMLVDSHTYLTTMGKTLTKHEMDSVRRRFDELGVPRDLDFLHGTESEEGHLQTVEERVDRLRGIESKTMLPDLHEENSKQSNFFAKLRLHRNKLFDRHEDMRAWSQWEIL